MLDLKPVGENKKASKPLMEKRRRARINHCLAQLKSMIIDPNTTEGTRQTKLEKADILEMTVRHLHEIKRRQRTALVLGGSQPKRKFQIGFAECAREVDSFLSQIIDSQTVSYEESLPHRLRDHLSTRLQQFKQDDEPVQDHTSDESEMNIFIDSPQKTSHSNTMSLNSTQNTEKTNGLVEISRPLTGSEVSARKSTCSDFVKSELLKNLVIDHPSLSNVQSDEAQREYSPKESGRNAGVIALDFVGKGGIFLPSTHAETHPFNLKTASALPEQYHDLSGNQRSRCCSDTENQESEYPEDLSTCSRYTTSVSSSVSENEPLNEMSSMDSGLGMHFDSPFQSTAWVSPESRTRNDVFTPPSSFSSSIPVSRMVESVQGLRKSSRSNNIIPNRIAHNPYRADVGLHVVDNANAMQKHLIKPKRLPNGDWALVLPQYMVHNDTASNPFSAFHLVWPSSTNDSDRVQYRHQCTSSPLSSGVSDMSEEYCTFPEPAAGNIDDPEADGMVWRPW